MIALIDTNIVLDLLLKREQWLADSQAVWKACDDGLLQGHLSAVSFTNIFYLGRRQVGTEMAFSSLHACLESFEVVEIHRETITTALKLTGSDFEDNVQIASAIEAKVDRIVSRNTRDFTHSPIPVVTPAQILAELKSGTSTK